MLLIADNYFYILVGLYKYLYIKYLIRIPKTFTRFRKIHKFKI